MDKRFAKAMWIAVAGYERAALTGRSAREPTYAADVAPAFHPATDMTACLAESVLSGGESSPAAWACNLAAWTERYARSADSITRQARKRTLVGIPWNCLGMRAFERRSYRTGHDPLLRNALAPAASNRLDDIFTFSWKHTILTHWSPLNVICSALHAWIIHHLSEDRIPFTDGNRWLQRFARRWNRWGARQKSEEFEMWASHPVVACCILPAQERVCRAEFDPVSVSLARLVPSDARGNVLRSLQHAVWFTRIAIEYRANRTAHPASYWHAAGRGPGAIAVIAKFGRPAAPLAAIAGPMIASATGGELPVHILKGLSVFESDFVFRTDERAEWLKLLKSASRS